MYICHSRIFIFNFYQEKEIPKVVLEDLVKIATYTPSSNLSSEFNTNENIKGDLNSFTNYNQRHCSNVRYRPIVYNDKPGPWQQIGTTWDRSQERNGFLRVSAKRLTTPSETLIQNPIKHLRWCFLQK